MRLEIDIVTVARDAVMIRAVLRGNAAEAAPVKPSKSRGRRSTGKSSLTVDQYFPRVPEAARGHPREVTGGN